MNVPFPFRVAAGAIVVGLDRLRTLPAELPGMSVTLAGRAVRASMRVQQELAQLAARGDEVLSTLTDRPEEHPAWARFDDEEDENAVVDGEVVDAPDSDVDAGEAVADTAIDDTSVDDTSVDDDRGAEAVLPGYGDLSVAQLRARLRALDEASVAALLDHERSGRARAAFVTTLHNRLTSLRSDGGAAGGENRV